MEHTVLCSIRDWESVVVLVLLLSLTKCVTVVSFFSTPQFSIIKWVHLNWVIFNTPDGITLFALCI